MQTIKEQIFNTCLHIITEKINTVDTALKELKETGAGETKSTAGDKHETALAMIQIEQENKRKQLREFQLQKAELLKIDPSIISTKAVRGSIIYTDSGIFFISISLGKLMVNSLQIICLSAVSPLGQKLYGCVAGDEVMMPNGNRYKIELIE